MAIEVFSGTDRFGRFETDADRARAYEMLASALAGTLALDEELAERTRRYRGTTDVTAERDVSVHVDLEASAFATVVEVHAPDDVGLLARVAAVFAALDLDVSQAIVSTVGDRVDRRVLPARRARPEDHRSVHPRRPPRHGARPRNVTDVTEDPFAPSALDLVRWAETLSAVARTGLGFTQSLYERERFEEVLKVAADIRAAAVEEAQAEEQFEEWLAAVGEGTAGYVTPKVAVAAVVGNDKGEILLTQRADSGMWLYPVGYADPGLFAVGDRGEGGLRGNRHRSGAGVAHRGARRSAPRVRALPAVLVALPLPDARR